MAVKDNTPSFDEVYSKNSKRIFRFAYRITDNVPDAEDIMSETFLIYLRKRQTEQIRNHDAYVTGISSKVIGNYLRAKKHRRTIPLDATGEIVDEHGMPENLVDSFPPGLKESDREILLLRLEENLTYEEIARQIGLPEVSCRSRFCRAKEHLKQLSEKENFIKC